MLGDLEGGRRRVPRRVKRYGGRGPARHGRADVVTSRGEGRGRAHRHGRGRGLVVGLRREGAFAVRAGPETPEALTRHEGGELVPILLTERQSQPYTAFDGALGLVVIPELSPLAVSLLIAVDE